MRYWYIVKQVLMFVVGQWAPATNAIAMVHLFEFRHPSFSSKYRHHGFHGASLLLNVIP